MSDIQDLKPARPDVDEDQSAYMPKPPWRVLAGLAGFLALSIGAYQLRERRETETLLTAVREAHEEKLAPLVSRYEALTQKLYALTVQAARAGEPKSFADPRLDVDALHKGKGLYLRLKATDAVNKERIASASLDMPPDAIGKCLGLSPLAGAELLARGSFLAKRWIEQANGADKMKLRVIAEEIRQRTARDLPFVADALQSQWFMLVLERGENRRDAPVDVYLWNLRDDSLLLSTRARADGALIAARIAVSGVKPGSYANGAQTGAAADCSIAAQIRALGGDKPVTFEASPPAPREAIGAAAPMAPSSK